MVFSERVRNYGSRGKGVSARDNHIIKGMKALHLLAALAWAAPFPCRPSGSSNWAWTIRRP